MLGWSNAAHPVGWIDYPRTLEEFDEWFPSEAACVDFLVFVGLMVSAVRPLQLGVDDGSGPTAMCGMPASDISDRGDDLRGYAQAVAALVSGDVVCRVSALGVQRILGLGSYQTAWTWLHKLRHMVRPGRDLLSGEVEVDETYLGGREVGVTGRKINKKSIVAIAAEIRGCGTGRMMARVKDASGESLVPFAKRRCALERRFEPMAGEPTMVSRGRASNTSRRTVPPAATQPTSSCPGFIGWPVSLIGGGWVFTMGRSAPPSSIVISTSSRSASTAADLKLVASCFTDSFSKRCNWPCHTRCWWVVVPTKAPKSGHYESE